MKKKAILFFIVIGSMLISASVTEAYPSALYNQNTQYEQKQAETERAEAVNSDFDSKQPLPDKTPFPIKNNWQEIFMKQGTVMGISQRHIDATPPVVYIDKYNAYHRGYCENYLELTGGTLGKPYWLTDVILDGMRCADCISDKTYYGYMEAMYKAKLEKQDKIIKVAAVLCIVALSCILVLIIKKLLKGRMKGISEIQGDSF